MKEEKRVLYSQINNNITTKLVEYLDNQYNWKPIAFNGYDTSKSWIDGHYPDALLIISKEIRQGIFNYSRIGKQIPVDSRILKTLSPFQSNVLSWVEDTTGHNASFTQRLEYYHSILSLWITVIEQTKPDIFISYTWPHLMSDYPLYLLCKYVYSIPVLFLDIYPHIDNRYVVCNSLENLSSPFEKAYSDDKSKITSKSVIQYINNIKNKKEEQMPKHMKAYFDFKLQNSYSRMYNMLRIIKQIITGTAFLDSNTAWKKNFKPFGSTKSRLSHLELTLFQRKVMKKNKILKKYYDSIATFPKKEEKYVYFAAPYQPEAASNLPLGVYDNLTLTIKMIVGTLPEDYKVYYKEHPSTFKNTEKGSIWRSEDFYNFLNSNKKVEVISDECNTYKLIDRSVCTISVAGSTGWYSIIRNKPTIILGQHWISSCKSVINAQSRDELKSAFKLIQDGFNVDSKDVERYAQAIYMSSVKDLVTIDGWYKNSYGFKNRLKFVENEFEEMKKVAEFFYTSYLKYYSKI